MAFTKVVGPGIHTLAQLRTHNIHSAGIITATKFVGEMESGGGDSTFQNVTVNGNLTVQGDTTTLNTTLRNVELLRVAANSTTTAGIITQTGTGDILNLFDGTSEVMTVVDGGKVGIGTVDPPTKLNVNSTTGTRIRSSYTNTSGVRDAGFEVWADDSGTFAARASLVHGGHTGLTSLYAQNQFKLYSDQSDPTIFCKRDGKVGINSESGGSRLEVNGGTSYDIATFNSYNNDGPLITIQRSGTSIGFVGSGKHLHTTTGVSTALAIRSQDALTFATNGANERLRILSDGGVRLIKTGGNANFTISRNESVGTTNTEIGVLDFASNTAHTVQARVMGKTLGTSNVGGDLVFETRASGGSLDERVRITGSGAVGIGVTNPDTLLELSSTQSGTGDLLKITSTTNSQSSRPGISFWNNNPNTAQAQISAKGGASYNASKLHFAVANTSRTLVDRACIDENGTFIIGPGEVRRNTKGSNQHQALLVEGTGNNSTRMSIIRSSNDDVGPEIQLIKTRGSSVGSVTKPNSQDYIGALTFIAGDDTDLMARAAEIGVQTPGTPANDTCPGDIIISVTNYGGNAPTERLRIGACGVTTTSASISFPDNKMAIFGNSSDLQIWHDGNNSRVSDRGGAGNLQIETNNAILMQTNDSTNCMAKFFPTGNYQNEFYNDNDWNNPKLRTSDHGVDLFHSGDFGLSFSDDIGEIGRVAGFQAVNKAMSANTAFGIRANDIRFATGSTEKMRLTNAGLVGIGLTNPGRKLHIKSPGQIKLESTDTGNWLGLEFLGSSGTNNYDAYMGLLDSNGLFFIDNNSNGNDFCIAQNGKVYIGADATEFSDAGTFLNLKNDTYGGRIGFSNNTATAGVALMEQFAYWGTNKVAGMIVSAGTDTTNKDDASMSFYTAPAGTLGERLKIASDGQTYFNHPMNITAGSDQGNGDATLKVTATTDNDWGIWVQKNTGSATEYGINTDVHKNAALAYQIRGSGSSVYTIDGAGAVTHNMWADAPSGFISGGLHKWTQACAEYHYTWGQTNQEDYYIDLTCGSYFQAEFIYTSDQSNGGHLVEQYARGNWANNHTTHRGMMHEWIGGGGNLVTTFTVSDQDGNGSVDMRNGMTQPTTGGASYRAYIAGGHEGSSSTANGRLRIAEDKNNVSASVGNRSLIVKVYYGSFSISKSVQ